MLRCCLEDETVRDFGAPAASCVDGGAVIGKEAVERGVPGIDGGRGKVAAVAAGVNTVGADADVTNGEAGL
jgi:hypothetical protein